MITFHINLFLSSFVYFSPLFFYHLIFLLSNSQLCLQFPFLISDISAFPSIFPFSAFYFPRELAISRVFLQGVSGLDLRALSLGATN